MDKNGITGFLVSNGLITQEQIDDKLNNTDNTSLPILPQLIQGQLLDEEQYISLAADFFNLNLFDLESYNLDYLPKSYYDEKLTNQHYCLPLYVINNILYLAISNPLDRDAIRDYGFSSKLEIEPVIVKDSLLRQMINRVVESSSAHAMKSLEDLDLEEIILDIVDDDELEDDDLEDNDEPIIKYINKVIVDAINNGASDIHFEPYAQRYRIRYRIDGILQEISAPPLKISSRIAARIKIMAQLNIAERRLPQDGRFKLKVSRSHVIDFRVSICPTAFGEKVVLRLLDQAKTKIGIDKLGFEPHQKEIYASALKQSQGMILVTGPTGSGKTVTLYTGLHLINTIDKNISTVEDPVEINVNGINQVQINIKQGLTFARALKAFLRQDPDIIMVGEIRDFETADIAIKAAQTGHLVLSTVHTNSAPETINRLIDMGIPHYNIVSSVSLIIAQRLARKLCPYCKEPNPEITKEILLDMGIRPSYVEDDFTVYKANHQGCSRCNRGYRGRLGIFEVMPLTLALNRLIIEGRSTLTLAEQAQREGVDNLQQAALIKVAQGLTSIEEAHRVSST